MIYTLHKDKVPLNALWTCYVDAATRDSNPSSTAAIGLITTYQPVDEDRLPTGPEVIYDMRAVTINGSSISNNVAEMRAVLYGYQYVEKYLAGDVMLCNDSRYATECVNKGTMLNETALTWSNILAHRQYSGVNLVWCSRNTPHMRLADFLALLSVASGEEFSWRKHDDQRAVINAFFNYKPRS
jgi:ribonuclease HI